MSQQTNIPYRNREFFLSKLFNHITAKYEETVMVELVSQYKLCPAKGGENFRSYSDMNYPVHILNGLYPALLLLEQFWLEDEIIKKNETPHFSVEKNLCCFIIGFTLHDLNKMKYCESLEKAVASYLENVCNELKVNDFFSEWKEYLEEIRYVILKTEEKTKPIALKCKLKNRDFFEKYFSNLCQFADTISFNRNYANVECVEDFYNCLEKTEYKGLYELLSKRWKICYLEMNNTIHTLLSQKLLVTVRRYIVNTKRNILFNMHNGFIYLGEPIDGQDIKILKEKFLQNVLDSIEVVALTKIDEQQCSFGFQEICSFSKDIFEKIIEGKLQSIFVINTNSMNNNEEFYDAIRRFLDENEIPLKIEKTKTKTFLKLEKEKWDELMEEDRNFLILAALEKIRFLNGKQSKEWKKKYDNHLEKIQTIFDKKIWAKNGNNFGERTLKTMAALQCVLDKQDDCNNDIGCAIDEAISDIQSTLKQKSPNKTQEVLNQFFDYQLVGNFQRTMLDFTTRTPVAKTDMCLFCGQQGTMEYEEDKSFGIRPRGFNNRCLNTLKIQTSNICFLCYLEQMVRRSLYKSTKSGICVYYHMGDYFIDINSYEILKKFQKAGSDNLEIEGEIEKSTLIIEKAKFDVNLYQMTFWEVKDKIEDQFYFIRQMLKMIHKTGFKIYCADIVTPYRLHKETFYFENAMSFANILGWDKVRLDQIEYYLQEIELLKRFSEKRSITSYVVEYSQDRRALFSFYYEFDKEKRGSLFKLIVDFIITRKEMFNMTTINELAEIALSMARLENSSSSEESWFFRHSYEVLKLCVKEGKSRENTIQQIAGELRSILKRHKNDNDKRVEEFATSFFDRLFKEEWQERLPAPNRLKHWRNQFAFVYANLNEQERKKNTIKRAIEGVEPPISWETVWQKMCQKNPKIAYYQREYEEVYATLKQELEKNNP